MVKRYYIFRHGETFATKGHFGYGLNIYSASILDTGIPTIEKLAEYLKDIPSDYNVCSEFKRCRQTVAIVEKTTGKKFEYDAHLNEYILEPIWRFRKRVRHFIEDCEDKNYETVMICTHGAVMAALKHLLTTHKFKLRNLIDYPKPGILMIIEDGKLTEVNFN